MNREHGQHTRSKISTGIVLSVGFAEMLLRACSVRRVLEVAAFFFGGSLASEAPRPSMLRTLFMVKGRSERRKLLICCGNGMRGCFWISGSTCIICSWLLYGRRPTIHLYCLPHLEDWGGYCHWCPGAAHESTLGVRVPGCCKLEAVAALQGPSRAEACATRSRRGCASVGTESTLPCVLSLGRAMISGG